MAELSERIKDVLIEEEMKQSYLTYAVSTLTARAIPDVRDGLKPSQRRILVAMNDLNLGPRSKFRKCAKIAGDTSGNYHPHGDQVVYPTLVRMAQDFNTRYPLIDGQGNFGSIDGDPPAAQRYTEARMTGATMVMLEDIEKDTVDYVPNYENTRTEPTVLPSKFPNLLVNGATGIAVGMATSIPPHNLREVCDAIVKVIDDPGATVEELLQVMVGPDFPTGGLICGASGIREAYETGRGKVTVRARAVFEQSKGGKTSIIITEIPYQINKVTIIDRIVQCVKDGAVQGVQDVRDESDREGMRLVIDLKRGEEPEVVLNQLYKHTSLQTTFSINLISLRKGRPECLSILDMIRAFIEYRMEVIRRRTRFLLDKAEARLHIVEGLLRALDFIDAIIALIRGSKTRLEAKDGLMTKFKFSDVQAEAILTMQLQRLVGLEREKLEAEAQELRDNIHEYKAILSDEAKVYDIIREDTYELKEKYGDPRRTEIVDSVDDLSVEDLIAEEDVVVTVSHENYIKRTSLSSYRRQGRGGQGVIGNDAREGDFTEHLFIASTHDYILFFTNKGQCHWLKVYDIPQLSRQSRGRALVNMLQLGKDEHVASMIPVRIFDDRFLLMGTKDGQVKKTELTAYSRPMKGGIIGIKIDDGDELIGVRLSSGSDEVMLATAKGKAIRFNETDIRSMGRNTRGVTGIKLGKGDYVVDMLLVEKGGTVLSICENGYGKRTPFEEYRLQKRGGMGVINIKANKRNGDVVAMKTVRDDDELMMITVGGKIIRTAIKDIRTIGRNTQGVRMIKMASDEDKLVAVAPVRESEAAPSEETGG